MIGNVRNCHFLDCLLENKIQNTYQNWFEFKNELNFNTIYSVG